MTTEQRIQQFAAEHPWSQDVAISMLSEQLNAVKLATARRAPKPKELSYSAFLARAMRDLPEGSSDLKAAVSEMTLAEAEDELAAAETPEERYTAAKRVREANATAAASKPPSKPTVITSTRRNPPPNGSTDTSDPVENYRKAKQSLKRRAGDDEDDLDPYEDDDSPPGEGDF